MILFYVLKAVTTWANIIHKLRIAGFYSIASVCMAAYFVLFYHIHKLTRKFPLSIPTLLWWVLSDGLSYPWHSLVVLWDVENEVCIWLHHSSTCSFPCLQMTGELLLFSSHWETQTWCGTTSSSSLKALSTNALEMRWLPEFVPELQVVSSLLLSSRANIFPSSCFLPFYQRQTEVADIPNLQLHAFTFVLL